MTANFQKLGRFGLRASAHRGQHGKKRSWNCCALIGAAANQRLLWPGWFLFTVEAAMATASPTAILPVQLKNPGLIAKALSQSLAICLADLQLGKSLWQGRTPA